MKKGNLKERNVWLCILFSIFTFGLYGIYWVAMLIKETGYFSRGKLINSTKVLLTIVTCGVYGFVWANDVGLDLYYAGKSRKVKITDKSVMYVLLPVVMIILGILFEGPLSYHIPFENDFNIKISIFYVMAPLVVMCFVQNDLNKLAKK